MGLAWLPQPSRLIADHSVLLPVLQPYPLAMNFVHGIDPDSHLLGGWQLDPSKLNMAAAPSHDPATRPEQAQHPRVHTRGLDGHRPYSTDMRW